MILLITWFCLLSNYFVIAPPMLMINHHQPVENATHVNSHLSNTNSKLLINRRDRFDINSYRSSWKFIDKHTVRVRFRLYESLLNTIVATRFLVRHLHSGNVRTFDEPHEIINSTITVYLHNMKHGRHIVCLLLYRSKLMLNPRHIFCQDIIFNFQRYGHHDMDVDEAVNTFVFLLTQYSIVVGILCLLQLIHAARKRRFLKTVYDKASALRNLMTENHTRKSTTDLNQQTHALEYLIYNLNRNALYNIDQMYLQSRNDDETDILPKSIHQEKEYDRYLKIPKHLRKHSIIPLLNRRRSLIAATKNFDDDEEIFDESDFDTRSYEEQSPSYKSVSHILEENKPWMAKLTDNGNIKHSILSSEPQLDRLHRL